MSFMRGARQSGGFPKNGEMHGDVTGRHSREGWLHVTDHSSVYLQGKQYRNMKEWSRPCSVCGAKYSVFEKAGTVDANSRFSNRTCDAHRNLLPAVEKGYIAWNKELNGMIAGTMCVGGAASIAAASEELETMRMVNKVMKEELAGLYTRDKEQFNEIQVLKAKLAPYELGPAMVAAKPAFDPHAELAKVMAKNNSTKMPWES